MTKRPKVGKKTYAYSRGVSMPEGNYTMTVVRVRKVRNKPQYRIHYECAENGRHYSEVISL